MKKDLALFTLRATMGGLMAGHGAQKLFGAFDGYGLEGTGGWLESMGMRPGKQWAMAAGVSELGGGMLTALGLGGGIGPIMTMGAMAMASLTVHKGKPIWVSAGGAELPVVNMAIASALAMAGPGAVSMDKLLGIKVPGWVNGLAFGATAAGVAIGLASRREPAASSEADEQVQQDNLQAQAAADENMPFMQSGGSAEVVEAGWGAGTSGLHLVSGGQTFSTTETPGGTTNPMSQPQPNPAMARRAHYVTSAAPATS
jgi:putative oxidoreductase